MLPHMNLPFVKVKFKRKRILPLPKLNVLHLITNQRASLSNVTLTKEKNNSLLILLVIFLDDIPTYAYK